MVIIVTNTNSSGPGSLDQAVQDAPNRGVIRFSPLIGGKTIQLTTNIIVLALVGEKELTIDGECKNITITNSTGSIFTVNNGVKLTLSNLTLSKSITAINILPGAEVNLYHINLIENIGTSGSAILNQGGICNLECCLIEKNQSEEGTITNFGTLRVNLSKFIENNGGQHGGGIYNFQTDATAYISNCTFDKNNAFLGSAISVSTSQCTIINSTIINGSGSQGAFRSSSGSVSRITNCTIFGNIMTTASAVYNGSDDQLTIVNSTISGNTFTGSGALVNLGVLVLANTIIAGNLSLAGNEIDIVNSGTINSGFPNNVNFIGIEPVDPSFLTFPPNKSFLSTGVTLDQLLETVDPTRPFLRFNGGPTQTIALVPGSVAIDCGIDNDAVCPTDPQIPLLYDQRGCFFPRRTQELELENTVNLGSVESCPSTVYVAPECDFEITTSSENFQRSVVTWNPCTSHAVSDLVIGINAFTSVKDAVEAVCNSINIPQTATVCIAKGCYNEDEIILNKNIAIQGEGAGKTIIQPKGIHRLFRNDNGSVSSISCLTLRNGISDNGGAIFNFDGVLTVSDCELINNQADFNGGAIAHLSGELEVIRSTLRNNKATQFNGGGVFSNSNFLSLESTYWGNHAGNQGGGIAQNSGNCTIRSSTIAFNTAQDGGGFVRNSGSPALIVNSTFYSNSATQNGGGIMNRTGNIPALELVLINTTLTCNCASRGGGIYNTDPNQDFLRLDNTIIAGNQVQYVNSPGQCPRTQLGLDILSQNAILNNGHNFIGEEEGALGIVFGGNNKSFANTGITISQLFETDSEDKPILKDNGGPTKTVNLYFLNSSTFSPAIQCGDNQTIIDNNIQNDQRGAPFIRILNSVVDLGAVEFCFKTTFVKNNPESPDEFSLLSDAIRWVCDRGTECPIKEKCKSPPICEEECGVVSIDCNCREKKCNCKCECKHGDLPKLKSSKNCLSCDLDSESCSLCETISRCDCFNCDCQDFEDCDCRKKEVNLMGEEKFLDCFDRCCKCEVKVTDKCCSVKCLFGTVVIDPGTFAEGNEIVISKNVQLMGAGKSLTTISGSSAHRVFSVTLGVRVTMVKLAIRFGQINSFGAGIYNLGNLTLRCVEMSNNQAIGNSGGAIRNSGPEAIMRIYSSRFIENQAEIGGGIDNQNQARAIIRQSEFISNVSIGVGGGIINRTMSQMIISCSSFIRNSSSFLGGGIYNSSESHITMINTTIALNRNTVPGNNPSSGGAGIDIDGGTVIITNSTIVGNISVNNLSAGGGIRNNPPIGVSTTLVINNVLIAGNQAGSGSHDILSTNPIVNNNANFVGVEMGTLGMVFGGNDNKSFTTTGVTLDQLIETEPLDPLVPLPKYNGGCTQTVALVQGSVAIDCSKACVSEIPPEIPDMDPRLETECPCPPVTDQRGFCRSQINSVLPLDTLITDIGAYEFNGCPCVVYVGSNTDFTPNNPTDATLVDWLDLACSLTYSTEIGKGDAFTSLQTAIETVCPFGKVLIAPGVFMGEIVINKSVTLRGFGSDQTVLSGGNMTRVIRIESGDFDVKIECLRISNGQVSQPDIQQNIVGGSAIFNQSLQPVTICCCEISQNVTISSDITVGTLYSQAGTLSILYSTVKENTVTSDGLLSTIGGIIFAINLNLISSTVSNNSIIGVTTIGLINVSTFGLIVNSTISNNITSAETASGTIQLSSGSIINSTIVENRVSGTISRGGGIYVAVLENLNLSNTILASNTISSLDPNDGPDIKILTQTPVSELNSNGANIIGTSDGVPSPIGGTGFLPTDKVGTFNFPFDPKIGPLSNNGGPTETHPLLEGSPAIDMGNNQSINIFGEELKFDQRCFPRKVCDIVDIGSYEYYRSPKILKCPEVIETEVDYQKCFTDVALDLKAKDGCGNLVPIKCQVLESSDPWLVGMIFKDSFNFPKGETLIGCVAIDSYCGKSEKCEIRIIVRDTQPPVITCPSDVQLQCNREDPPNTDPCETDGKPGTGFAFASDNCSLCPVVRYQDTLVEVDCQGDSKEIFRIERLWTADDRCGNTVSCLQKVSLVDTIPPVFIPSTLPNITIKCSETAALPVVQIFDLCDPNPTIDFSESATQFTNCTNGAIKEIIRTWKGTDACGNMSTLTQIVSVVNDQNPKLIGVPCDTVVECDKIPCPPIVKAVDACSSTLNVTFEELIFLINHHTDHTDDDNDDDNDDTDDHTDDTNYFILQRTWKATDSCGNTSSKCQQIKVLNRCQKLFLYRKVDSVWVKENISFCSQKLDHSHQESFEGNSVAISDDGDLIASGCPCFLGNQGAFWLWKKLEQNCWKKFGPFSWNYFDFEINFRYQLGKSIALSGDGKTLVVTSKNYRLTFSLEDLSSPSLCNLDQINCSPVALSGNGKLLISG